MKLNNHKQLLSKHLLTFVGYNYTYPFLSVDCGICIADNIVNPLYKCIFNIEHPTMVFIGVINLNFEVQVSICDILAYNIQLLIELRP